jgi:hypothetical protein
MSGACAPAAFQYATLHRLVEKLDRLVVAQTRQGPETRVADRKIAREERAHLFERCLELSIVEAGSTHGNAGRFARNVFAVALLDLASPRTRLRHVLTPARETEARRPKCRPHRPIGASRGRALTDRVI